MPLAASCSADNDPNRLLMIQGGGKGEDAIRHGYADPFTRASGVPITMESGNSLGKLRAMVESGRSPAAMYEMASAAFAQAKTLRLLNPLDWTKISPLPMFPDARDLYGIGYQYFSTVMAWRRGARAPRSWRDFFDVGTFPGPRALPDHPHYALAFSLIADGVAPARLFPLDLERAFAKIRSIKDHIPVWWKSGSQPPQLLKDGEVDYAITWATRVVDEPSLDFTFADGMYDIAWIVVPRGVDSHRSDLAMRFLHELTVPRNQANASRYLKLSGNSPGMKQFVDPATYAKFPLAPANRAKQWRQDGEYWGKHGESVNASWQEFKLSL